MTLKGRTYDCSSSLGPRILQPSGYVYQQVRLPALSILGEPSAAATAALLPTRVLRYSTPTKTDLRAQLHYALNFRDNNGRDYNNLLDEETGRAVYSCDITWHHPEAPWITQVRVAPTEALVSQSRCTVYCIRQTSSSSRSRTSSARAINPCDNNKARTHGFVTGTSSPSRTRI